MSSAYTRERNKKVVFRFSLLPWSACKRLSHCRFLLLFISKVGLVSQVRIDLVYKKNNLSLSWFQLCVETEIRGHMDDFQMELYYVACLYDIDYFPSEA